MKEWLFLRREVLHHSVDVGDLKRVRTRVLGDGTSLDEDLLNLHVVDDGTVSPRTLSKTTLTVPSAAHAHTYDYK